MAPTKAWDLLTTAHPEPLSSESQFENPAPPLQEKPTEPTPDPPRSTRAAVLRALAQGATEAADWEDKEEIAKDKWCMMRLNGTQRLLLERLVRLTWKEMKDYHEFQSGAEIAAIVGVFKRGYGYFNGIRDDLVGLQKAGIIRIQFKERQRLGISMTDPASYSATKPKADKANAALDGAMETQPDGQQTWLEILASCQQCPNVGGNKASVCLQEGGTAAPPEKLLPLSEGQRPPENPLPPQALFPVCPQDEGTKALEQYSNQSNSQLYSCKMNELLRLRPGDLKQRFLEFRGTTLTAKQKATLLDLVRAACGGRIRTSKNPKAEYSNDWRSHIQEDPQLVIRIFEHLLRKKIDPDCKPIRFMGDLAIHFWRNPDELEPTLCDATPP